MKKTKEAKIIDCECNGSTCCGGRGIAAFEVTREGKRMMVCTRCDLSTDTDKRILRYVLEVPPQKLIDFDAMGAICLAGYISNGDYPITD